MKNVDQVLGHLSAAARSEPALRVDVRARVLATLRHRARPAPLDLLPIVFAGASLTIAAATLIAMLPIWRTLAEPWVAYLP